MIWYLIFNFANGGTVVIPEPSRQMCEQQRKALIIDVTWSTSVEVSSVMCITGLPAGKLE